MDKRRKEIQKRLKDGLPPTNNPVPTDTPIDPPTETRIDPPKVPPRVPFGRAIPTSTPVETEEISARLLSKIPNRDSYIKFLDCSIDTLSIDKHSDTIDKKRIEINVGSIKDVHRHLRDHKKSYETLLLDENKEYKKMIDNEIFEQIDVSNNTPNFVDVDEFKKKHLSLMYEKKLIKVSGYTFNGHVENITQYNKDKNKLHQEIQLRTSYDISMTELDFVQKIISIPCETFVELENLQNKIKRNEDLKDSDLDKRREAITQAETKK